MIDLILACAPNVHPITIQALIKNESSGNPLAVGINTKNGVKLKPTIKIDTAPKAIAVTYAALALGHSVDMGYMQVNSVNLKRLGYTVDEMFYDQCKNIKAGAQIFTEAYLQELPKHNGNEQAALSAALSIYNTGNSRNGFMNGYVGKYYSRK